MTDVVLYAGILLLVCFSFVLLFGAPYLPTKKMQIETAIDLMQLKKGSTFIELGCGDGRVLKYAAKQGIRGIGYELNPLLYIVARVSLYRYRRLVTIHYGNYWRADWPKADAIYTFLLDTYMKQLDSRAEQYAKKHQKKVLVVSFAFAIPHKKPIQSKRGLFLYRYN
jgi:16S rRNA A1518/A1519 N6-dimethyltransferase RsmA/KsgA/DIM1 with predicted DNA glycosylase/AP lyase activity